MVTAAIHRLGREVIGGKQPIDDDESRHEYQRR
jgi:hypothetical protein